MTRRFERLRRLPVIGYLVQHRFVQFGIVGATGTLVNVVVLYIAQEFVFRKIESPVLRLNLSLATAIFFSTANNFLLNRRWTWFDRRQHVTTSILLQFGQYSIACWLGIGLQFVLTHLFARHFHYLLANVLAIIIASVANFLVNDQWTFGRLQMLIRRWQQKRGHPPDAAE
ncbi:GtrA family protein [Accumulibacter sp.]|uniref:GtrA family protein n=1 Tax=Accumulibacter sp. TaxID=2053492 RepID=UPI002600B778|nr:GtrA family protein [Accumulibacter sp.]MCM8594213.1 GtrA family protein [Accumulibacter sp.]MCM8625778.1 GtrA family protein [Accumulibacter sp.]MDS4048356.1 GtrA family protein [Accumulibacter sp.]